MKKRKENRSSEIVAYESILDELIEGEAITKNTKNIIMYYLGFYIKKANEGRLWYVNCNKLVIILTAVIPFISFSNFSYAHIISGVLAIIVNITISLTTFKTYKLSWLRYRKAAEDIKKNIRCVLKELCSVDEKKCYDLQLIEKLNDILVDEVGGWNEHTNKKDEVANK